MPLRAHSRIGPYAVTGPLGKGGMGEVWRARDARLGRDVAIKALPIEFAGDPDRLARFEREAKVLASLNHANIASIYGLEQADAQQFLILELVEGETLAERVAHGAIPSDEALRLAIQIADAIEAAHEKDIIHRDLKPANIKLTPDGKVKVLDFGLAKAFDGGGSEPSVFNSPTLSLAATAQGVILGTAAYMSPEQARGQAIDRRTDIWAFGCIVYEMLTGRHAFRGEHVSDILASVLAREPEYAELPPSLPPRLKEALRRCFEKNPKRRWQAIGDLRVELEQILADPTAGLVAAPTRANGRLIALAAVAAALIAAPAGWLLRPQPPPAPRPVVRFEHLIPQAVATLNRGSGRNLLAVSPDGRWFAYNTNGGIMLRAMNASAARLVPGTDQITALSPTFSPDGEWIAYWATNPGALQKIAVSGGAPVTIARTAQPFSVWWGPDGNLLFADLAGIKRVSADGGTPALVIDARQQATMGSPSLLADGKTILYSRVNVAGVGGQWDQADVVAQEPGGSAKVLLRGGSDALYVSTGHLTYAVGNALYAVPFDLATLSTTGGPVPVVTDVQRAIGGGAPTANYGITNQGTLVYFSQFANAGAQDATLGVVDRSGVARTLNVPSAAYRNPRVSPDGRQIVVETLASTGQSSLWVYDTKGGSAIRRLTQDGDTTRPVWSADGKRIAYAANTQKPQGIFWQLADGSGLPERLTTTSDEAHQDYPESFSRDGKVLSFARVRPPLGQDAWSLWTMRLDATERTPAVFFDLPTSNEFGSQFSPDGKWIAYASNASPQGGEPTAFAIYMQPYPPTGVKYQISQTGGAWPIWSPDGHELIYRLNGGGVSGQRLHTVTVSTVPVPTFGAEQTLPIQGFLPVVNNREYDVFPDGKQLVMVFPVNRQDSGAVPPAQINAVLNWTEELKARVPVKAR